MPIQAQPPVTPPVAPVREHRETRHGATVIDPYFWLRDKSSPDVVKHLEAENAYTEALNGVAKTINRTGKGYSFDVLRARLLFRSPGVRIKFGPLAPVVPHNGPGSADPQRVLRCMSCFGLFDKRVFKALHHIQPIAPLETPIEVMALCGPCNARFHTD